MDAFMLKSGEARNAICKSGTSSLYGRTGSSADRTCYFDVPEDISSFTRMKVMTGSLYYIYNWTPSSTLDSDMITLVSTNGSTAKFEIEINSTLDANGDNVYWTLYKLL